ncbi:MAG: bifunctional oligoribonuclease/PAP phosphatase NrnA [Gudongella sp.]|nr:bifunctional oligoribonuclease/PAP phosphatase NrnA [Gudongella sp.]
MNSAIDFIRSSVTQGLSIAVVSHKNPDGDSLGSLLAMGLSLEKLTKNVIFVKPDIIPEDYLFLPGLEKMKKIDDINTDIAVLIVLDCSDPDRLGLNKILFESSKKIINIDHHISNTKFGDINIVVPESSSTGEIVFDLLSKAEFPIDTEIATCIYTAISTDTGRFSYESVTKNTHLIISKLYDFGINGYNINKNLYQKRSLSRTKLFILAVSNLKFYEDGKIAIAKVTKDMYSKTNAHPDETEGIVEFLRDTDGVEVACLLKELNNNDIKLSLRTKEYVDANKICSLFGGGGHIRASGASSTETIEETEKMLLQEINKYL